MARLKEIKIMGINILTIDNYIDDKDAELLDEIRNFKSPEIKIEEKEDFADYSGKSWKVDKEFSKLCIEGSGWK